MRHVIKPHRELGGIDLSRTCRDDMPALLTGLQHLYCDRDLRSRLFALLEEHLAPNVCHDLGRPGMNLWPILVMQGLNCDFDRLHDLVNEYNTLRQFLGHADIWDRKPYSY